MLFASDPVSGAINISNSTIDAGSRFTLNLPYPMSIPATLNPVSFTQPNS
jgi:hypothetical protein